ncbi:MAG: hypothetical protein JW941_12480 [Candidatus Coatesbacteria bacterium]|nr:hypothetical protein [Candidatus Coatesbacteria bacterium]
MTRINTGRFLLIILVCVNLVNGTLLAILTPMWLGADEYTHYGYIKHIETHGSFPDQRNCRFSQELEMSIHEADWWRVSGDMGKVGPGPERFYAHGFLQFAAAGECALERNMAHTGSCSLALRYKFRRAKLDALGVYLSPVDISESDAIGLWVKGDGSDQRFEIAIDTPQDGESHKFTTSLDFDGFRRVFAPFERFSGDLMGHRSKNTMLKLSILDSLANDRDQTGTVLVDDIWFQKGSKEVKLTGFELEELPNREAGRLNWAAHHPPLYYLLGVPIEYIMRNKPIFTRAFALRLFSLLLSTVSIVVAAAIGKLLFGDKSHLWLLLPCLMVFSPAYSLHQSCINNDHLVILLYTLLLYLLLKWQDESLTTKRVIAIGVICGLGTLSKMLFVTAFPVVAIYMFLNIREFGLTLRRIASTYSTFAASTLAVCGWWFIRNFIVYGKFHITATTYLPARSFPVDFTFLDFVLSERFLGWIGIGWLMLMSSRTDLILVILTLGLSGAGFAKALYLWFKERRDPFGPRLFKKFTLLFYAILIHFSAVLYVVATGSIKVGRFRALHGRYFFPVLVAIAALWAFGLYRLLPEKGRNKYVAAVVAILIALETSDVYITAMIHWYPF